MSDFRVALAMFKLETLFDGNPRGFIDVAQMADKAGIDQVFFTDHVIMGENTANYPYGQFPVAPDYPWFEPLTLLSAIASVTQQIRLSTGVLISPLRPASLLAKTIATLDNISNGRVDLGLGVGWQKEEYLSQGLDFEQRWKLLDDQLDIVTALWQGGPSSVATRQIEFDRLYSYPLPVQREVPLWFGVAPTVRQARRVAQFGNGWIPISGKPDYLQEGIQVFAEAFDKAGRDFSDFQVRAHADTKYQANGKADLERALDSAATLAEAGATVIAFNCEAFAKTPEDIPVLLERIVSIRRACQ